MPDPGAEPAVPVGVPDPDAEPAVPVRVPDPDAGPAVPVGVPELGAGLPYRSARRRDDITVLSNGYSSPLGPADEFTYLEWPRS
ncbi:hypothetical protein [Streptomyces sp. NPDC056069]|uniref:hypothetical protein n=1 Tax=Streptomyces sp. NPDC056069 TaxID=3345702 RepID=UPI0035E2DBE9